jgi:chromosome segregation ATPase
MGNYRQSENRFKALPIEPSERLRRFPGAPPPVRTTSGCGAALDLVYQAAEVIEGIENQANEAENVVDEAFQKLRLAEERIEELEKELQSAQSCISEARIKIKESEEATKVERSRLEAAEAKMYQIEMRARTAEAQATEKANAVSRIEEAIRTEILAKRKTNTLKQTDFRSLKDVRL